MSKTILLHLFITLLILDWSYAFTTSLKEHQDHGHHNPETHHSTKRHASRRNNRYLNEEEKPGSLSTAHRQVRRESTGSLIQDNIQDVFNMEANSGADHQMVKRQSAPTFHQNNVVPGSSINNHFHQYPAPDPVYQQPQQLQYPVPLYPYNFGLAPIFICYCSNQPPTTNPQNNNVNSGNQPTFGTPDRFGPDDENTNDVDGNQNVNDYRPITIPNTPTGISLDRVPPRRNDSRRPPPIAHGPESNSIIPPNNVPQQLQTSRPIYVPPTPAPQRPLTQRPVQRPTQRPNQRPTQRPLAQRPADQGSQGSGTQGRVERTNCAFAILQCCRNKTPDLRCFKSRECPGPFFDNPCDSALAQEVSKFVNSDSVLFIN